MSDETRRAIGQIDRLKELREGWDSYEAHPVGVREREAAKLCILAVEYSDSTFHALVPPVVSSTADPGVALIWKRTGRGEVDALFTPSGAQYVVFGPDRKMVTTGSIGSDYKKFAQEILTRHLF